MNRNEQKGNLVPLSLLTRKLRHEVSEIREEQERIVEAVAENKSSIGDLDSWLGELNKTVALKQLNLGSLGA